MAEPGPLVHPKWARTMASAGAAMCAGAQALPAPWDVGLFVVGWCVAYAGGAQLQQPEWLKGRRVVELAAVPVLMALGGLAGAVAVWKPHLREGMGAVAVVCAVLAGKARQEAVVVPPGLKSLALALLAAGALQGCATTSPRRSNVGDWVGGLVTAKPARVALDAPLALPVSVGPCVGAHGDSKAGAPLEGLCSTLALSSAWDRTLSLALLGDWQAGPVGGLGLCGELTDGKRPYEVSLCAGGEYAGRFGWWSAVTFQAKILPEP